MPGQRRPLEYILPVIATRTVTTTVCVRAGRTIMLGALGGGGLKDAKVVAVLLRMTRQAETGLVHGQSS